jgi:ribonuclease P protein component
MLSKEHRLTRTKDFQRVLSNKRGIRESGILIKTGVSKNTTLRIGIVVSRKVAKKAVDRNRIRRVILEEVRSQIKGIADGADIVFVVIPGFELKGLGHIHTIISSLLKKASLL